MIIKVFNYFNNKKLSVLNFLSVLGICCFFGYSLYYLIDSIYYILNIESINVDELENKFNEFISIHTFLLSSSFVLLLVSLFFKKLSYIHFLVALLIGYCFGLYSFLDDVIHPFLVDTGVYHVILNKNSSLINPQYTRLLLNILFIIIMFVCLFFKRFRNLQRIMILLMSGAILTTTMLFHFVIPMGFFQYMKKNSLVEFRNELNNYEIKNICKIKSCLVYDESENILFKTEDLNDKFMSSYTNEIKSYKKILKQYNLPEYSFFLGNFNSNKFDYWVGVIFKYNDKYILVLGENKILIYSRISEYSFVILAVFAHLCWIYLFGLLMFLHTNKKIYKAVNFKV